LNKAKQDASVTIRQVRQRERERERSRFVSFFLLKILEAAETTHLLVQSDQEVQ